jgi:hypothetical protein
MAGEGGGPAAAGGLGRADTTVYRARSGALVFSAGTLSWELGLSPVPGASPQAPHSPERALVRLTLNLLWRVLRRPG